MRQIVLLSTLLLTLGNISICKAQYIEDSFSPDFTKEAYIGYSRKHNDKIVLGGDFKRINETSCNGVAVLNEDGTIYNILQSDQLEEVRPFYILAASDSLILLNDRYGTYIIYDYHLDSVSYLDIDFAIRAASFYDSRTIIVTYYDWETREVIVKKVDEVGNEISGFDRSLYDHNVEEVRVLSNGKIAVAGSFESVNKDTTYQHLALLTSDGQIDGNFIAANEVTSSIYRIREGETGQLFLIGYFPSTNANSASKSLIKLKDDGSIDERFSLGAIENTFSRVTDVYTGENEAVYVSGSVPYNTVGDFKILKLKADGSFDSSFKPFTTFYRNFRVVAQPMLITPLDGNNILLAGGFNETNSGFTSSLAVVDDEGTEVDINLQAFNAGRIITSTLLNNKNILVGGDFKFFNGIASPNGLEILTPEGDLSTEFNLDDRIFINELKEAIPIADGKILIAGQMEEEGQRRRMMRLMADGTIDASFSLSPEPTSSILDIAYVESSKCIYTILGGSQYSVVKYDSLGNLVESFSAENELPEDFSPIRVFPDVDGNLFVSGYTNDNSSLTGGELYKITAEGKRVSSFKVNGISHSISELVRISDSTLMHIGGFLIAHGSTDSNPVYIINNEGEIIDQYSLGVRGGNDITNNHLTKIVLNSDTTKAYILGQFNYTNDYNSGQIVEVNLDLSIEKNNSFYGDGYIFDAVIDHDTNELTFFGDFSTINETERFAAARLKLDNYVPELVGTNQPIVTAEDTPLILQSADFVINDKDYYSHELIIGSGEFYSLGEGNEIVPASDYYGLLEVPISVTDGRDSSNTINIKIEVTPVNDAPRFVSYTVLEIPEDSSITLKKDYFQIEDPDSPLEDISILFEGGDQYEMENDSIMVPVENFNGTLSVSFKLNDGTDESEQYLLPIEVTPVNDAPQFVGYTVLEIPEDSSMTLKKDYFQIEDPDSPIQDISILFEGGDQYVMENDSIMVPVENFNGTLSVSFKLNDGTDESEQYLLPIEVLAVNDAPEIIELAEQIVIGTGTSYTFGVNDFIIEDPDNNQEDFQIILYDGENYEIQNNEMILASNFSGNLSVSASVYDGKDESTVFQFPVEVDLLLSNKPEKAFQGLSLHPNPANVNVILTINDPFIGNLEVSVIDLSGAELLRKNVSKRQKALNEVIHIESLKAGIYFIKVVSEGNQLTSVEKILVTH